MTSFTESEVEDVALKWLEGLGWSVKHGPDIAPGTPNAERDGYDQIVLERRLADAIDRLNADLPSGARGDALRKLTRPEGATIETRNRSFHRMLVDGVSVEYREQDGSIRGDQAKVVDFDNPWNNDWLAVNQFTVTESGHERRPDTVLFVNGLPLGVIELKNPADPDATMTSAWNQLQTYKSELPTLFSMNEAMIVSDGNDARMGTLTAGIEWFKPWRTISGETWPIRSCRSCRCCSKGRATPVASSRWCATSSCSRTTAARWSRRWLDTISFMPSAWHWMRHCGQRGCSRRMRYMNSADATSPAASRAAPLETGESV